MKKIIITMLVIVLAISFCSCEKEKSEAATAVDEQILAIGEISLDSKDVLEEVEAAINALEEKDKKQLENLQVFEDAKESYSNLLVEHAEELIDEIGTVTLDSLEDIETAEDWISELSEEEKDKVENIDTLDEARSSYDDLEEEEEEALEADFTNSYGTPTTMCNETGCSHYIASSGDTWNCPAHSNICLECGDYCDGDAMYCGDCLFDSSSSSSDSSGSFTNSYGTPTTICNASGCSNYIASSGDTWNCPEHSNICLECGDYCDGDAMYCGNCLFG